MKSVTLTERGGFGSEEGEEGGSGVEKVGKEMFLGIMVI